MERFGIFVFNLCGFFLACFAMYWLLLENPLFRDIEMMFVNLCKHIMILINNEEWFDDNFATIRTVSAYITQGMMFFFSWMIVSMVGEIGNSLIKEFYEKEYKEKIEEDFKKIIKEDYLYKKRKGEEWEEIWLVYEKKKQQQPTHEEAEVFVKESIKKYWKSIWESIKKWWWEFW